jgi:hypothetical protein
MIFWLKIQDGWTEKQKVEHTGANGGPIQSANMTNAEFEEIARNIANEF